MKNILKLTGLALCLLSASACDQNASQKTIRNSKDTTSVNKAGGPPIRDTATITKDRRDSAKNSGKSNAGKGNADPSGRIKN
ncbi:hypothetical protein [Mucilaginibacter ginsenosidivorax]|uniref:Lipoprotein n=1 Tax=Mucilaginibacter ginsenosidivorax TaxID=862126 RepID=A0A5B8VU24_9SPHI|nr:hypothetical protein [Mucilaginibacter ginsenosidivorax]QEC74743.1 hypothetical protein FSB76_01815 [Mucilaginibacter ginsenosidivorax]